MDRRIEVVGERESEVVNKLKKDGDNAIAKAKQSISFDSRLYNAILFVPNLENNALGLFIEKNQVIALDESILDCQYDAIRNIFLHELAHALEFNIYKECSGHGERFHKLCALIGVEEGFEKARTDIKSKLEEKNKAKAKVNKLLSLSGSTSFDAEAALALSMAEKLTKEYALTLTEEKEEKLYLAPLIEKSRISASDIYIINIVERATGIFAVRSRNKNISLIRIFGSLEQVELAIYLFDYLDGEIDREIAKLRHQGKSITKNGFTLGVYQKLKEKLSPSSSETTKAIVLVKEENKRLAQKLFFKEKKLRNEKRAIRSATKESIESGNKLGAKLDLSNGMKIRKLT